MPNSVPSVASCSSTGVPSRSAHSRNLRRARLAAHRGRRLRNAIAHSREALTLFEAIGDHHGQGEAWDRLGLAHHQLGRYRIAVRWFTHALDRLTTLDDRRWVADVLVHLGASHAAAGQPAAARQAWSQALRILEDLCHPDADPVRARLAAVDHAATPPG